jgi:plasmid stabilization system protein ParE
MMRLKIAEAASEDVRSILHFCRSPSATADAFSKGLDSELLYLRQWPYTGHRRRDLTKEDVCFGSSPPTFWFFKSAATCYTS